MTSTSEVASHTRLRSDGRMEVADTEEGNDLFGCKQDHWCILANGHDGECNEDRELSVGPNIPYGNVITS